MAKNKEQQRVLKQPTKDPYQKIIEDNQRKIEDKMLNSKRSDLEKTVENFGRKAIERELKFGADDTYAKMYVKFYNALFQIQEFVDMVFTMKDAMGVISGAMNMMDEVFGFINDTFTVNNANSYSFVERFKMQRKINKFIKYNKSRMKSMLKMAGGVGKIADSASGIMDKFNDKFSKTMGKGNANAANDNAKKQLDKLRKEMGADTASNGDNNGASAESAPSNGDINIDDIV